jgi:VanZ family protein
VLRLLLLVIALILYGSLYPWHFHWHSAAGNPLVILLHSWSWRWDRFAVRDAAANVLFYIPLGAVAFLTLARRRPRMAALAGAVLLGAALSASIEMLQIYVPGRYCSLVDLATNTVGAALGAVAALAYRRQLERKWVRRRAPGMSPPLLLLAFWLGHQLFPFIPILHPKLLLSGLAALINAPSISGVDVWANAAEWLAAAVALEVILRGFPAPAAGGLSWRWLGISMLCLPLRTVITGRTLSLEAVLGAALALLLWRAAPARWRRPAALWALAGAIVLRELAPFHFAHRMAPFSWIPFAATLESNREAGMVILLRKAYDYGAVVWLLHLAGWRYARAAALVAAVLAVFEGAQRYLPGRTPEITDPLLALLMALVLWWLDGGLQRKAESRPR